MIEAFMELTMNNFSILAAGSSLKSANLVILVYGQMYSIDIMVTIRHITCVLDTRRFNANQNLHTLYSSSEYENLKFRKFRVFWKVQRNHRVRGILPQA
jgi:hypothetical protein